MAQPICRQCENRPPCARGFLCYQCELANRAIQHDAAQAQAEANLQYGFQSEAITQAHTRAIFDRRAY